MSENIGRQPCVTSLHVDHDQWLNNSCPRSNKKSERKFIFSDDVFLIVSHNKLFIFFVNHGMMIQCEFFIQFFH